MDICTEVDIARSVAEVVEHHLGVWFVMRTQQGPFPMETTYTWEPHGVGTLMTLRNRGTPSGISALAGLVMAPAVRRVNRNDLARPKPTLEAQDDTREEMS